jgi:hypothetical protein
VALTPSSAGAMHPKKRRCLWGWSFTFVCVCIGDVEVNVRGFLDALLLGYQALQVHEGNVVPIKGDGIRDEARVELEMDHG